MGPGPMRMRPLSLSSTLDHRPTPVPQPNKISRAGRTQKEFWDFFDCFLLRNAWKQISGGRNIVFYVFIVYILMLLSKGTETRMNFRFEVCDVVKSLGCHPALHPRSSNHTSLQPSFISLMGCFKLPRAQRERRRRRGRRKVMGEGQRKWNK